MCICGANNFNRFINMCDSYGFKIYRTSYVHCCASVPNALRAIWLTHIYMYTVHIVYVIYVYVCVMFSRL